MLNMLAWLKSRGVDTVSDEVQKNLQEELIEVEQLALLSDLQLQGLGFKMGHRLRILAQQPSQKPLLAREAAAIAREAAVIARETAATADPPHVQ